MGRNCTTLSFHSHIKTLDPSLTLTQWDTAARPPASAAP
jgi:hypothetical protein